MRICELAVLNELTILKDISYSIFKGFYIRNLKDILKQMET